MRHETTESFSRPAAPVVARPTMFTARAGLVGLVGTVLVVLMAARAGLADPAVAVADGTIPHIPHVAAPPPAAVTFLASTLVSADDTTAGNTASGKIGSNAGNTDSTVMGNAATDNIATYNVAPGSVATSDDVVEVPTDAYARIGGPRLAEDTSRAVLEELLFVRALRANSWKPQTTDEALAVAVASGTNPDLVRRSAFRKRSLDLFRAERPVSIGNADMIMRLRLRPKARKAVSVEFRF